ncbi:MAG: adenylate/guanylate cyclase domain-containing protein [Microthrixaceae bacterium]
MNCPSCAAQNADDARFCSSCGQPLSGTVEERRVVTVLFADLVGFTSLSEHRDPEAVKRVVDGAFERLVVDITSFGGKVDKIVGDAILALFGAPVAHEDDAERAVRAALRMQQTLAAYCADTGFEIRMRVGVNTGEVLVGALRAGGDYTAMGDVVNLASRLQTTAEPGDVIVGDATHAATVDSISYEDRGQLTARGREQTEHVWVARTPLRPPGPRREVVHTPLVGREAELATLVNSARGSIRHGRAELVVLIGEAGVGKTRLAHELADVLANEDEVAVFEGRCLPYGEVNPWWPIAEVLRGALSIEPGDSLDQALQVTRNAVRAQISEDAAEVDAVVDGLLHILGYDGALRELDGTAARAEATSALLGFLEARLANGAVMIRLADLHWADDDVLAVIDELLHRMARQPFVLVATARRALQERWSPRPGRFNNLLLNVDPLNRDSVAQLLGYLTDGTLGQDAVDVLLDRSGGNPFYLEELVTLLQDTDGVADIGAAPLPETLRGLVAARIDGLTSDEQDVLGDAAVWGTSGVVMVLDKIAEAARGVPSVAAQVASLAEKDVLVLDGPRWEFRSDLVREVTYARLTKQVRLGAHAGIARYLDNTLSASSADDATVDVVTRHFTEAALLATDISGGSTTEELTGRAVHWLRESARRASAGGSWPLAVRLYSRILEMSDEGDVRLNALLGRSTAYAEQWDPVPAEVDARAALGLADEAGSSALRAKALRHLAAANMRAARWEDSDRHLAEALGIEDSLGDTGSRGETLRQQGLSQLLRGDHRAAETPILGALEAFRTVSDRRGEGWAFQSLAWIAFGDGRLERAAEYIDASSTALTEAGDRGGLQWTNGLDAFLCFAAGDFEQASETAQRVLEESERRGDRFGLGMMYLLIGGVELWSGHPLAAVGSARRALDALDRRIAIVGVEQALTLLGRALVMSGDLEEGFDTLSTAIEMGSQITMGMGRDVGLSTEVQVGLPGRVLGERFAIAEVPSPTALLWLLQVGRSAEAEALRDQVVALGPGNVVALAVVDAIMGRSDSALAALEGFAELHKPTYNDAAWADLLSGLLDPGADGALAMIRARDALRRTQDRVMPALLDLADALRGVAGGESSTTSVAGAERALSAIGLADTRWRGLFERILAAT